VLGTGEGGIGEVGYGPDTLIRFPERLAIDPSSTHLLVADAGNHRVLRLDLETLQTQVLAGTGEAGFSGDGATGTQAQLHQPMGVVMGPNGIVVIADTRNHVIRSVDSRGTVTTIAGTGEADATVAPSAPLQFSMLGPAALSWSDHGDLIVAEQWGHRILQIRGLWDAL